MNKQKGFLPSIAGVILCLMLSVFTGSMALAPRPAYAVAVTDAPVTAAEMQGMLQDAKEWIMNNAVMMAISKVVNAVLDSLIDWFRKVIYYIDLATASESASMQSYIKARTAQTQAIIDSEVTGVYHRTAMRTRGDHIVPVGQELCNNILIGQLPSTTETFERAVTRAVLGAIEGMYRGDEDDGAGPQYASDQHQLRCASKTGNPIDYPGDCVDKTTEGARGRKLADADIDFDTLADGDQVLELPAFETVKDKEGNEFAVPNPKNAAQKFWTAGLNYCYNLAGPRPSPPRGKDLDTAEGRVRKAKWDVCAAKQSKLLEPCARLLAHHTRPNTSLKDLISAQTVICLAAKLEKIDLPMSFEDCVMGVSPYQAEYLAHAMCKNPQHFIGQKLAGSTDPKMMDASVECATAWNLWEETEISLETDVIDGISGLLDLQKCWKDASKK